MNQLAVLCLLALSASTTFADDAPAPQQEMSEEEAKEAVFTLQKQLVAEVNQAVTTINDIFGNPQCEEDAQTKRDGEVQKRGWGKFVAGAAAGALLGKREEEQQQEVQKRGWGKFVAGAAAGALLGKREEEQQREVQKRGWGKFVAGAAAGALLLGKREEEQQQEVQKRGWGKFVAGAAAGALLGKREKEQQQEVQKRGWGKFVAGAAAGALLGKKDQNSAPKAAPEGSPPSPISPSDPLAAANAETAADDVQFQADVDKLEEAVSVLGQVLLVAQATLRDN